MLVLRPRLKCAADMVNRELKTVDIGTDHAYLPAYLVLNGMPAGMLACDIGEKPLMNAEKTLKEYKLQNRIRLRVSDGLKLVSPEEADQITVCGLGGILMRKILEDAPWIKKEGMHLVLNPMTHAEVIREYLCLNGFKIDKEKCVQDAGHTYCILSAYYTGIKAEKEPGYYYYGNLFSAGPDEKRYMEIQYGRVCRKYFALRASGQNPIEADELYQLKKYYERRMKE